jgi:hypothetical protein
MVNAKKSHGNRHGARSRLLYPACRAVALVVLQFPNESRQVGSIHLISLTARSFHKKQIDVEDMKPSKAKQTKTNLIKAKQAFWPPGGAGGCVSWGEQRRDPSPTYATPATVDGGWNRLAAFPHPCLSVSIHGSKLYQNHRNRTEIRPPRTKKFTPLDSCRFQISSEIIIVGLLDLMKD